MKRSQGRPVLVSVVDDFAVWRRLAVSMIETQPRWRVVSESSNGLEAVQHAKECGAQLTILDMNLPGLNGIAACRLMREHNPALKVLFSTQESDPQIIEKAFEAGARGYVHKLYVRSDLLP